MKTSSALAWLLLSLPALSAAQPAPPDALPASIAIVVAPRQPPRRPKPAPLLICGAPVILKTLTFESDPDSDLVYLMDRREGGWSSLLTLPGTDRLTRQPVGIPVAQLPALTQPTPGRGISHLIACWVAEKDHDRLTRHTAQIARLASSAIQQRYAIDLARRTFTVPYQRLCALYLISRYQPRYVFQRHFGTLIAPVPVPPGTPEQVSYIRREIIETLSTATDATNIQQHWAWMQKATDPDLKDDIFRQLLFSEVLRQGNTTGIETHLRPPPCRAPRPRPLRQRPPLPHRLPRPLPPPSHPAARVHPRLQRPPHRPPQHPPTLSCSRQTSPQSPTPPP